MILYKSNNNARELIDIYSDLRVQAINKIKHEMYSGKLLEPALCINNTIELSIPDDIYHAYITNAERNSIVFFNSYVQFYADSHITLLKLLNFSKFWTRSRQILPDLYINEGQDIAKNLNFDGWYIEHHIMSWMKQHNIQVAIKRF